MEGGNEANNWRGDYVPLWTTGDVPIDPKYQDGWDYLGTQVAIPWGPEDIGAVAVSELNRQPPTGYPAEWHPGFK